MVAVKRFLSQAIIQPQHQAFCSPDREGEKIIDRLMNLVVRLIVSVTRCRISMAFDKLSTMVSRSSR